MNKSIHEECPSCSSIGVIAGSAAEENPRLSHWPIQIKLVGTVAPFLNNADLLVAADCTAFAVHDFHRDFLKDRKVLIGCPKLDNAMTYVEKFTEIFSTIPIRRVSCLRMEVPCCGGMTAVLKEAITKSGKAIPLTETIIGVKGDLLGERQVIG
ncbi:MAG TPA: hypothetical protein VEI96_13045 [Thermodesulfovibrionales bacterium]|nr:hypothetical protein [Thermodesulfovibrionales bacterium]